MKKRILKYAAVLALIASPIWADVLIQGFSGTKAEVDTNTRALRTTLRPNDVGALGAYGAAAGSGVIAAGMATDGTVYSFRWTHSTNLALIDRIEIGAASLASGFTAGTAYCQVTIARNFTASDTGGNVVVPTKKRASFGASLVGDVRVATTGALTPGTRTLDAHPMRLVGRFTVTTAVQTNFIPSGTKLYDRSAGDWPIVLKQDEGFVVQCTVPATGTWAIMISPEWTEVTSY